MTRPTALDLVGDEHARGCTYGRTYSAGDTSAAGSCTCSLAERQQVARELDAELEALRSGAILHSLRAGQESYTETPAVE